MRTAEVLDAVRDKIPDRRMRSLGFCVSIEHAVYIARHFTLARTR